MFIKLVQIHVEHYLKSTQIKNYIGHCINKTKQICSEDVSHLHYIWGAALGKSPGCLRAGTMRAFSRLTWWA